NRKQKDADPLVSQIVDEFFGFAKAAGICWTKPKVRVVDLAVNRSGPKSQDSSGVIELVAIEQWITRFENASRRPIETDTTIAAVRKIDRNRITDFPALLVPPAVGQV